MLIGVNGKAGAGKDTVADYLVKTYGFVRYAFADAVRDVATTINPIIVTNWQTAELDSSLPVLREIRLNDYIENKGWDWTKRNISEARRLLQVIGTEVGRQLLGENLWVDIIFRKWSEDNCPNAVITDMRFPNEFKAITDERFGLTIKVNRPDNPNAIVSNHVSEAYDFDCNYTIINDSTLEKLYTDVDHIVELIGLDLSG